MGLSASPLSQSGDSSPERYESIARLDERDADLIRRRFAMVRIPVLYPNEPGKRLPMVMDRLRGIGAHGKEIMGDIPNYTDLAPQIQVSEIVVAWAGPVAG